MHDLAPTAASEESSTGTMTIHNPATGSSDIKPGMITDVRNLYESKPDSNDKTTWVDAFPTDLEDVAEGADSARYALLIRNEKCYDGRKNLQIHSIVVQSPLLKESLGRIFEGYPGVTTSLDRLTFDQPFQPFVHRWGRLVEEEQNEADPEAKSHLTLLRRVMETELKDTLQARDDFILNGVITYDTCWMIFEPGCTIFTIEEGKNRAVEFSVGEYTNFANTGKVYKITSTYVEWDGEQFGYWYNYIDIKEFGGTKKIDQLPAFPLDYHPSLERIKQDLVQRGRRFEALSGYHYKYYQGVGVVQTPWGPVRYTVNGRIIIDTHAWNGFNGDDRVVAYPFEFDKSTNKAPRDIERRKDDQSAEIGSHKQGEDEGDDSATGAKNKLGSLTDQQLLTCTPFLRGYALRNKKWLKFTIDAVKEITLSDTAFESLVLPGDYKELILALTMSHACNKDSFDDVIQGKGKGIVMLLSGPPGVGKTLTAESVAEEMKVPLYIISASDLGASGAGLESSLSSVLEMATKWKAVLLLDEADVFLEQRSSHDLTRNQLVSVFLRMLEYYEGVLFLTTNRVEVIDPAFQSRIHLSLRFKELSFSSRKHVWSNLLAASAKSGKASFNDADLDELAEHRMNGREIKNVLKLAQLLASKKGEGLSAAHVQSVLAIEQRHASGQSKVGDVEGVVA